MRGYIISWRLIKENFIVNEFLDIVTQLSSYHRIQGTNELVQAAKFIRDILMDKTRFSVNYLRFNYSQIPKFLGSLIGWYIKGGKAEITSPKRKVIADFTHYPTSIVAFSPPGDFEGEVRYVGDGLSYDEPLDGIALTYGKGFEVYAKLVELGAKAIIFFRRDLNPDGIPYVNLFPSESDIKYLKAPAISVDRKTASKIIRLLKKGIKVYVKGFVESGYFEKPELPVIETTVSHDQPEYHIIAHFCHPRFMINDNISGTASLIEGLIALQRLYDEGGFKLKYGLKALFVPEYFGTYTYLHSKIIKEGRKVVGTLNLDMIGEKCEITKSIFNIIRSPIILLSPLEAYIFKLLRRFLERFNIRYSLMSYSVGSDHDPYIALGIPALMLNFWPDAYYHTNLDTIDKLDASLSKMIISLTLGGLLDFLRKNISEYDYLSYISYVKGKDLLEANSSKILLARLKIYHEFIERKLKLIIPPTPEPIEYTGEKISIEGEGGLISLRYIRVTLGLEKYLKLRSKLEDKPWIRKFFILTSAIMKRVGRSISLNDLGLIINGELNVWIDPSEMIKLLQILQDVGFLTLIRGP